MSEVKFTILISKGIKSNNQQRNRKKIKTLISAKCLPYFSKMEFSVQSLFLALKKSQNFK